LKCLAFYPCFYLVDFILSKQGYEIKDFFTYQIVTLELYLIYPFSIHDIDHLHILPFDILHYGIIVHFLKIWISQSQKLLCYRYLFHAFMQHARYCQIDDLIRVQNCPFCWNLRPYVFAYFQIQNHLQKNPNEKVDDKIRKEIFLILIFLKDICCRVNHVHRRKITLVIFRYHFLNHYH